MQIKEALKWGHEQLLLSSSSARLDAEILLSNILRKPTTFLLAHDEHKICSSFGFAQDDKFCIPFSKLWRYKRLIRKRKEGMPVAYLTGHKEFYFLDFDVNQNVLVPRPDTETLVECVIEYIRNTGGATPSSRLQLLDIGTGSGCIPISVCKNVDGLTAITTDISRKALRVARKNIKKHGLTNRINLIHSDLLENVPPELFESKEVIVTANLPYIPADYTISPELKYEPQISLFGGLDGLTLYKKIVHSSTSLGMTTLADIKPKAIFFELFEDQIAVLKTKLPDYKLKYIKNMSGKARVLAMEMA
jgi:release factor glutamine methyltransferase